MATDKRYTVFGISSQDGEYKVRFANDVMRIKVLQKHGHEDIRLEPFETAMTKYEGIQAIKSMPDFQDAAAQMAITEYLAEKAPKAVKTTTAKAPAKAAKVTAKTVKAPVKAAAAQAVTEDENAPF
jgi:hypothetical protein